MTDHTLPALPLLTDSERSDVVTFSPREQAHLEFARWLYQTGRVTS